MRMCSAPMQLTDSQLITVIVPLGDGKSLPEAFIGQLSRDVL